MKFLSKPIGQNSGIALLMTLFVLVFLSLIAMNFSFSTRWGSASARNFKEETKAYYAALSAYQYAVVYLLSDKDTTVDFLDDAGNFHVDKETKPVTGTRVMEGADVEIKITDTDSKININTADEALLKKVFDYTGIPADIEQEIVDSVLDWIDPDNLHRLSGAESSYYESLSPAYPAKNNRLDTVEEILLVKGFKPEYLYGNEQIKPLYGLITTIGDGSININTASREVMSLAGINAADIDAIMKQRTFEFGGAKQIPIGVMGFRHFTTASNNFVVEVVANVKGSKQTVKITSFVRRVPSAKGFDIQTIYWREGIESRRG